MPAVELHHRHALRAKTLRQQATTRQVRILQPVQVHRRHLHFLLPNHPNNIRPATPTEHDPEPQPLPPRVPAPRLPQQQRRRHRPLREPQHPDHIPRPPPLLRQPPLDRAVDAGARFRDVAFRVDGAAAVAEPFVVGARVAEEGEDAGTRGAGMGRVDVDEGEVGGEGGAEEARLGGEDGGGGAGAVEAEDGWEGGVHGAGGEGKGWGRWTGEGFGCLIWFLLDLSATVFEVNERNGGEIGLSSTDVGLELGGRSEYWGELTCVQCVRDGRFLPPCRASSISACSLQIQSYLPNVVTQESTVSRWRDTIYRQTHVQSAQDVRLCHSQRCWGT